AWSLARGEPREARGIPPGVLELEGEAGEVGGRELGFNALDAPAALRFSVGPEALVTTERLLEAQGNTEGQLRMAPEQRRGDLDRAIGVGHVDHEGGRDVEPVEDLDEARVPDRHVKIPRIDAHGHRPGAGGACGSECFSKPAEQRWALLGRRVDLRGLEMETHAVEGQALQGLSQAAKLRAELR